MKQLVSFLNFEIIHKSKRFLVHLFLGFLESSEVRIALQEDLHSLDTNRDEVSPCDLAVRILVSQCEEGMYIIIRQIVLSNSRK